jgi:hypothetical protein
MLGKSLLPLLRGEPFEGHLYLVSEVVTADGHGGSSLVKLAVLRDSHKLIRTLAAPADYEVYDLEADPREQRNLRGRYPELEEQLLSIARQHLLSVRVTQIQGSVDELYLDNAVADRLAGLGYLS